MTNISTLQDVIITHTKRELGTEDEDKEKNVIKCQLEPLNRTSCPSPKLQMLVDTTRTEPTTSVNRRYVCLDRGGKYECRSLCHNSPFILSTRIRVGVSRVSPRLLLVPLLFYCISKHQFVSPRQQGLGSISHQILYWTTFSRVSFVSLLVRERASLGPRKLGEGLPVSTR